MCENSTLLFLDSLLLPKSLPVGIVANLQLLGGEDAAGDERLSVDVEAKILRELNRDT